MGDEGIGRGKKYQKLGDVIYGRPTQCMFFEQKKNSLQKQTKQVCLK